MKQRFSQLLGAFLLAMSLALAMVVVPAQPATAAANNNETGYDFFVGKGLTKEQSAGIIGNLIQESGSPIDPRAAQNPGLGRGIAQWSEGGRWDELVRYANRQGQSRYSLNLQLKFIWYELERYPFYGLTELRRAGSVREATKVFQDKFERCGQCDFSSRLRYAESVYDNYGGGSGSTETNLPTLRKGSTGGSVRTLQYLLNSRYGIQVDGKFGPTTEKYVKKFQAAKGLRADGVVGDKTWGAILPTVRKGSKGNAVRAVQRELRAEGYSLSIDGKFGSKTRSAVVKYQQKKKLSADGVVGKKTWGSLLD